MRMQVNEYDHVVLTDGRDAAVMEKQGENLLVDVGTSLTQTDVIRVDMSEVVRVVRDEIPMQ